MHIRIYTISIIKRESNNANESIKHDADDNDGKSNDEIDIYYDDYKIESAPLMTIPKTTATQNQRRS